MKRQSILGGLAALALAALSLAIPGTASAAVTCHDVDATTTYPHGHFTQYCGTAATLPASAAQVLAAAASPPGSAEGELRTAFQPVTTPTATPPGVQFYVFHTPADYTSNFPLSGGNPQPGNKDFAVTKFDAAGRPVFSAIFEVNQAGTSNAFIKHTAEHEIGRSIDALMGYVMNGGVPRTPYPLVSASTGNGLLLDQLNADWTALNLLPPCTATGSGVFNGQADPTKPPTAYICNGTNGNGASRNAAYASMSNKQILQAIWPNYASADKLIAEEYGYYALGAIGDRSAAPLSQDIYIKPTGPQFQFACATTLITYVGQHGVIPTHTTGTTDNLPSACPSIIAANATTTCIKLFTSQTNGHFPDGRVMDCMPQPNSFGSGLAGKLSQLGGASVGVKQRLDNAASFVFIWNQVGGMTAEQRYKAAFTKAGVVDITITSFLKNGNVVNGWTAPFGTDPNTPQPPALWYTLMNADSPGLQQFGALSTDLLAYVTSHELGHTIDFNIDVPQPSNTADFDKVVQNDYLYLDYTVYPTKRKPCATAGGPLGYNGPFLNTTVPTGPGTTVAVCDGNASGDFGAARITYCCGHLSIRHLLTAMRVPSEQSLHLQ
jgi:hypothetical protein